MRNVLLVASVFAIALLTVSAQTTDTSPATAPAQEKPPADPFDRETPSGSVRGFLIATDREDYARATQYLDIIAPAARAQELAQQLGTVLDAGITVGLDHLSKSPHGELNDDMPNRDRLGVVETAVGKLEIFLDRVQRSGQPPIWLFSAETLRRVPKTYEELGEPWFIKFIPNTLREKRLLSIPLWRWFAMVVGLGLAMLFASWATRALIRLILPVLRHATGEPDSKLLSSLRGPIRILFLAATVRLFAGFAISLLSRQLLSRLGSILATIGFAWLALGLIEVVSDVAARRVFGQPGKLSVLALVRRLAKIVVVFIVVILLLHGAGVNVTAMLAGLGVGGIALALAAQKTLENLFGGISIIMREAIRVGDSCIIAGQIGDIEDIGLSSTRMRTLDRTVLSVPNAQIAQMNLENLSMRDKYWFHHILSLRRDTSPDQMRHVLSGVVEALRKHPKIEAKDARIQFIGFGSSSLDSEIFAYIRATDYVDFLRVQQELLLGVMDVVTAHGAALALPSQTTYLERDRNGAAGGDEPSADSRGIEHRPAPPLR